MMTCVGVCYVLDDGGDVVWPPRFVGIWPMYVCASLSSKVLVSMFWLAVVSCVCSLRTSESA